jgi:hypothetical protein
VEELKYFIFTGTIICHPGHGGEEKISQPLPGIQP